MAGAAVGRGVSQPHALDAAGVVGREFLAFHRHRQIRMTVFFTQALGTHAQFPTEAFSLAGNLGCPGQRLRRTELQLDAARVLFGYHPHLIEFHGGGKGGAKGNRIDPVLVTEEIRIGQRINVVNAGIRTQRPGRLVFQPA